jgi:sec-independent protein translocase protein TatA
MLSIPDMAVIGTVALLVFGPDQLPKVARKAGQLVRDVQNTSQSFIREMERAADEPVPHAAAAEPAEVSSHVSPFEALGSEESSAETAAFLDHVPAAVEPVAPRPSYANDTWSIGGAPGYHEAPTPGPSFRT